MSAPHVSIIIPVYNAPEALERCLDSVLRNTTSNSDVIVIDDASPDTSVSEVLDRYRELCGFTVVTNTTNRGFTATVNRGLRMARADVVLLNSDAEVPPRWLENLQAAAKSRPGIGVVSPLSDHAGAFSAPEVGQRNELPRGLHGDDAGRLVTQWGSGRFPEAPTGNGFCMYITAECLQAVGGLDEVMFPRGYGEENDFCMRARAAGFATVVDDRTFVLHEREASFKGEKQHLYDEGRKNVDARHPEYTALIRGWVRGDEMESARRRVAAAFRSFEGSGRAPARRVLYLVHAGGGGTPYTNGDLMEGLDGRYDCLLLTSDGATLRLMRRAGRSPEQLAEHRLEARWDPMQISRPDYRSVVRRWMLEHSVELLHVRSLFKHTFDAPIAAADLGIPIVLSFHDYYLSCPTVHLLDDQERHCGGICTPGDGACRIPSPMLATLPPLKHRYVHEWRSEVELVLRRCDAFVTTSPYAREVYRRSYPMLADRPFEVIEHGRDLVQHGGIAVEPRPDQPVRIVVLGNLDIHKGARYIEALKGEDDEGRLEFHFLGLVPAEWSHLGIQHGRYERASLPDRLREIQPSFSGIFSIWPETYCHTLSESWSCGVPVLGCGIGAVDERIRAHGAGVLLPEQDPVTGYQLIREVLESGREWRRIARLASVANLRSVDAMADDYAELYERVWTRRRRFCVGRRTSDETSVPSAKRPRRRVTAIVTGAKGAFVGSSHVRILRRLTHPSTSVTVRPRFVYGTERELLNDRPDLFIIQRSSLSPSLAYEFLSLVHEHGIPFVVELDDNLFVKGALDGEYGSAVAPLEALLDHAAVITVSTPALRDALFEFDAPIHVIPNMLDERLWPERPLSWRDPAKAWADVLYVGTKTHAEDLAILRPALDLVRHEAGLDVRLHVIGGEEAVPELQPWYHRIEIPPGRSHYPRFVSWLRSVAQTMDIAVAPLVDSMFNRYKSDLKFIEYTALGLPTVLSGVEAYRHTAQHGETALLARNTTEEWARGIARLADESELRDALVTSAAQYVFSQRLLGHGAASYQSVLDAGGGPR